MHLGRMLSLRPAREFPCAGQRRTRKFVAESEGDRVTIRAAAADRFLSISAWQRHSGSPETGTLRITQNRVSTPSSATTIEDYSSAHPTQAALAFFPVLSAT